MERRVRPVLSVSLPEWSDKWFDLAQAAAQPAKPDPLLNACRFGLTGIDRTDESITCISTTDAKISSIGAPEPFIRRDYDSIIGYSTTYPMSRQVSFFPHAPHFKTLRKAVHVKHRFYVRSPSTGAIIEQSIDGGKVPNILFGTFGERGSLRIHFPGLFEKSTGLTPEVSRQHRAVLYDKVIRPASQDCVPEATLDWPTSYKAAEFKDKNPSGGSQHSSVMISAENASVIANRMRQIVNSAGDSLQWAKHFVWGVEVRGIKDTCIHALDDPEFITDDALAVAKAGLEVTNGGTWYIDVGLEYILQDSCLLWSLDQHVQILSSTLGIDNNDANRIICRRGTTYSKDPATHLYSLSGFRTTTGTFGGEYGAVYVQAYTTDKSQTYHPHGYNAGKAITPKHAMDGTPPDYVTQLKTTYMSAKSNIDVAARLEVRVPFSQAEAVLRNPPDALWEGMVCYPRDLWWGYRIIKLASASNILTEINRLGHKERTKEYNLTLVLGLVYLINSLHSRPEDSSRSKKLCRSVLPLTADSTNNNILSIYDPTRADFDPYEGMPYAPGGNIYLRPFFLKPETGTLRFTVLTPLDERAFVQYWGCEPRFVREKLWPTKKVIHFNGQRVTSKKGVTKRIHESDDPGLPLPQFATFHDIPVPQEPTLEEALLDIAADPDTPPKNLADTLTTIYKQFLSDIIQKIPGTNQKKNPQALTTQYCPLAQQERQRITVEDIKNNNDFTHLFVCLQYKYATRDEWTLALDYLFPVKGYTFPSDARHYDSCTYMKSWLEIVNELSPEEAVEARVAMLGLVRDLPWLPAASRSRMWRTDEGTVQWTFIPPHMETNKKTAPQILINKKTAPNVVPFIKDTEEEARIAHIRSLREEEEGSD